MFVAANAFPPEVLSSPCMWIPPTAVHTNTPLTLCTKIDSCMSGTFPLYMPHPICATPYMCHAIYVPRPMCNIECPKVKLQKRNKKYKMKNQRKKFKKNSNSSSSST